MTPNTGNTSAIKQNGDAHRRGSAWEVLRAFLRLGVTSFGGPTAHIGYFHQEFVTERKWLTEQQFAQLLALCQFLPGPASSQLGFALGIGRAGLWGGLMAWIGFTLPSAALMVAFAAGAAHVAGPLSDGMLTGLKSVAVAVVAHAVWSMAKTLTPDLRRIVIAAIAAAGVLLLSNPWGQLAAIAFGIVAGLVWCRKKDPLAPQTSNAWVHIGNRAAIVAFTLLITLLGGLPLLALLTGVPLVQFIDGVARSGALVFGGGHVVLPLLQSEPAISAAVTPEQFLTGYGAAQALPGPLFAFAAYLGAIAQSFGGVLTAALSLAAVFLPGLLMLLVVLPIWNRVSHAPTARAAFTGANAAVVGLLAAALYDPIMLTALTVPAGSAADTMSSGTLTLTVGAIAVVPTAIAAGCLLLLFIKVRVWIVVLAGVVAGLGAALLGSALA